ERWAPTDGHGWHARYHADPTPAQRRQGTEQALFQYRSTVGPPRLAEGAVEALRDLLRRCRREHIPTTFVVMPVNSALRALLPAETEARLSAVVRALACEAGAPLIDAQGWIADDGFWDGHHLTRRGAFTFTRRLTEEFLRPRLAAPEQF